MTKASSAFLSNDPDDELNPLAYRGLLILSGVYRMWSKTRLRHLQPWVESWTLPGMFAGVEGEWAGGGRSIRNGPPDRRVQPD